MNTAFKEILDSNRHKDWCSNSLRMRAVFKGYQNTNASWRKHYRTCMIVPITSGNSESTIVVGNTLGFLCVDSKTGRFNRTLSRRFLSLVANMLYSDFVLLSHFGPSNEHAAYPEESAE